MNNNHFFLKNIRNLSPEKRLEVIGEAFENNPEFLSSLSGDGALPLTVADGMIENVIGRFELPLGVATNFQVNGKDYLIPMAVEEPSVVAAASYMAKLARLNGGFEAYSDHPIMRGQIQVMGVQDLKSAKERIPQPTGYRVVVMPFQGFAKSKGGIVIPDETRERESLATVVAYVVTLGPDAYKDKDKFPNGPYCQEGEWVIISKYSGTRIKLADGEIRILMMTRFLELSWNQLMFIQYRSV